VPVNGGQHGRSGFSFVTEFACPKTYSGSVVSKPGVFSLEISGSPDNRLYTFRMFGSHPTNPRRKEIVLKANGESDPSAVVRVAGVCTYYYEPEQSNVGYRLSLYLDGELLGSCSSSRFVLNENFKEPVAFASGMDVRGVWMDGCARPLRDLYPGRVDAVSNLESGTFDDWSSAMRTRAGKASARFIETADLVLAVAEGSVIGNSILGGWNRRTSGPLLAGEGLGWELEYAGDDGVPRRMRSNSRNLRSVAEFRKGGFVVRSEGNGFDVRHKVSIDGGRIGRTLDVTDVKGSRIRGTSFPRVTLAKLPGEDVLVEPQFGGALINRPTESYQSDGWMFPGGMVTMQLAGYYNAARDGIYFSAEDPLAVSKTYTADGSNGRLLMAFYVSAPRDPGAAGARHFAPTCCGALELYRGKWFELGQVYRKFLARSAPWYDKTIPRTDTPSWFMKNPLWIVNLGQNRSRLPAVRYLNEYFEVPTSYIVSIITAPGGGAGRYGPVYQLRPEVLDCIRELGEEGIRFLTYTNPRLWYSGPGAEKMNNYSTSGRLWSVKDEKGVPHSLRFDGEDYVAPCLGEDKWLHYLCKRTKWLSETGISGIYHDQLPVSVPFVCHDPTHGHKVGDPSVWAKGGLWRYCDYLMGDLRREHPEIVHTGEDASEPYVNKIDGFLPWRFGRPGHVPLFQSVYVPRVQFLARGGDMHSVPGSYESFFPKYAEQLCYGEQIGWIEYNAVAYPSPRRGYLKKLAHCRWALADFLNSSEMQTPFDFALAPGKFTSAWGVMDRNVCTVDKVLSSVWRHVDGRRLAMFLNVTNEPQEVAPLWGRGGKSFAVCREGAASPETVFAAPTAVRLAPYGFEFWVVDETDGILAEPLAQTLAKAADFWKTNRGGMLAMDPAAFSKTVALDATGGKEITPISAAWGLLVTIPTSPHCDFSERDPQLKDGWAAALEGGLVNYGTVDFGTGAKAMEMSLATDQKDVTVEFFDVSGDMADRKIAEFRPEAGGWHEYKPCVSPLFGEVKGRRAVLCRVTGGICNLKNWKVLADGETGAERPVGMAAHGPVDFAGKWTVFARRDGERLEMNDGGYAYCGRVDFGKEPKAVEFEIERAEPNAVIEIMDVTELAPSTPLARIKATKGSVSSDLSFKIEGKRNIVLMAKGGTVAIAHWRVVR